MRDLLGFCTLSSKPEEEASTPVDVTVPYARTIIDVIVTPPQRRRNGRAPLGYTRIFGHGFLNAFSVVPNI
jgi:hypothetical protein